MDTTAPTAQPDIQLFRDAFNASPIGIAVENMDGQPLFVNPALCSMLGFSEDELRGKHCVQFSPPDDAEKDWTLFQKLRAGSIDQYQLEKRYFRRDGALFWGHLSLSLLNHRPSPLVLAMVQDITEKKTAEEARFRLAAIVESSEDAIVSGTLDGIIVSWNAGAQRIYGYTEAEAIGKPIAILLPPELPDEEAKILEMLSAGDRIEHFETTRVSKAGKRINISLSISPIKDSSGRTVGISGIARDLTERKRAEEALFRYAAIVQSSDDAIISKTLDGVIVSWNKGAEQIYGHNQAEVVGKPITILVPPELVKEENQILEKLRAGESIEHYETLRVTKAGRKINVSLSISPIQDSTGRTVGFSGISRDITERKQAEEAMREMNRALQGKNALLQAREELLKTFVKNVPVAVAMLDRDMRYLQVSDRWCSDNSVEASEILGHSRYETPETPEHFKEVNRRALQGEILRADEDRWQSGGKTLWGRWEVRPWRNPDNTIGGILIFAEDITRRKQIEEELADMSRKLVEAQEQERARIGRELHDDINQRLAMLAVELEQPHDPSEFQNRVQGFRKELRQISDDVQALSHELDASKLEYLGAVAGMKSWCQEFGGRSGMQIDCRRDVRSSVPPEIGLSLFRVLQEALHNAAKHSGVKRIEVELREQSGVIYLMVRDSGKGFDMEAARQGRGLGLTSMRERVRLVNGTIAIDSKPMGGTTVHVRVPLESGHNAQRAVG